MSEQKYNEIEEDDMDAIGELLAYAMSGDLDSIQELMRHSRFSQNVLNHVLTVANGASHPQIAEFLLQNGASPAYRNLFAVYVIDDGDTEYYTELDELTRNRAMIEIQNGVPTIIVGNEEDREVLNRILNRIRRDLGIIQGRNVSPVSSENDEIRSQPDSQPSIHNNEMINQSYMSENENGHHISPLRRDPERVYAPPNSTIQGRVYAPIPMQSMDDVSSDDEDEDEIVHPLHRFESQPIRIPRQERKEDESDVYVFVNIDTPNITYVLTRDEIVNQLNENVDRIITLANNPLVQLYIPNMNELRKGKVHWILRQRNDFFELV